MRPNNSPNGLKDGAPCTVKAGTHAGKNGLVRNINASKTGAVTITVEQDDGVQFKTLAKHVELKTKAK
jgi:ribosomal protein S4E